MVYCSVHGTGGWGEKGHVVIVSRKEGVRSQEMATNQAQDRWLMRGLASGEWAHLWDEEGAHQLDSVLRCV
jgi:hypothetical protein